MLDPQELDPGVREGMQALLRDMGAHGVDRDAPERAVMGLLGDRWSSLILLVLDTGTWRHADLRRVMGQISFEGAISQRVLTLKLRALEADGFVHREATADVPPKVSYSLTPLGRELCRRLRSMLAWITQRRDEILAARQAFARED